MAGRTYRFFEGVPLYPFGYGLSYTTFRYDRLRVSRDTLRGDDSLTVAVDLTTRAPAAATRSCSCTYGTRTRRSHARAGTCGGSGGGRPGPAGGARIRCPPRRRRLRHWV